MSALDDVGYNILQTNSINSTWTGLHRRCGAMITRQRGHDTVRSVIEIATAVESGPQFYPGEKEFARDVLARIKRIGLEVTPKQRLRISDLFKAEELRAVIASIDR